MAQLMLGDKQILYTQWLEIKSKQKKFSQKIKALGTIEEEIEALILWREDENLRDRES